MKIKKLKYKIRTKYIILLCFALYAFLSNKPFFIWETYRDGAFSSVAGVPILSLLSVLTVVLTIFYLGKNNKFKRRDLYLALGIGISSIFLVGFAGGASHVITFEWLIYIVPMLFLLFSDEDKIIAYDMYIFLFAITLVFPMIYYLLTKIGVNIPYSELASYEEIKVVANNFYKLYPFGAAQFTHRYDPWLAELRMSGIYDEAGRLGTLAGLFLVSERFAIRKNWRNVIILLGGILSFSVAFYVIVVVYFLIENIRQKKIKNILWLTSVIVVYLIFISVDFSNPALSYVQNRIVFNETGFSGNNRTNDAFNDLYNSIYSGNIYNLFFGYGYGALGLLRSTSLIDGSSYKTLIFDFGLVGFISQILWLFVFTYYQSKSLSRDDKSKCYTILVVYLLNMYQRPTMFNMVYLLIFIGGVLKIKNHGIEIQTSQYLKNS